MITPFISENLFELNNKLEPKFDGEVIIIDNVFKNYKNILDICYNISVEQWKSNLYSRNFKDYYDCRLKFNNWFPEQSKIQKRSSTLLDITGKYYNLSGNFTLEKDFNFNYFKHLKLNLSKEYQHFPHYDNSFNVIFYIDPFRNGGTALYENIDLKNKEEENLIFNISSLQIKKIINSKPNRCVIFPGKQLHGGYIEDHNTYYYNWRINLVNFIKKI